MWVEESQKLKNLIIRVKNTLQVSSDDAHLFIIGGRFCRTLMLTLNLAFCTSYCNLCYSDLGSDIEKKREEKCQSGQVRSIGNNICQSVGLGISGNGASFFFSIISCIPVHLLRSLSDGQSVHISHNGFDTEQVLFDLCSSVRHEHYVLVSDKSTATKAKESSNIYCNYLWLNKAFYPESFWTYLQAATFIYRVLTDPILNYKFF